MVDMKSIRSKLVKAKAKRVMIQVPEGLKPDIVEIARLHEEKGIAAIISLEPCFGACDLRDREAKELGCDALVHIGHSDLGLRAAVPVIYEEHKVDFDPVTLLKRYMKKLLRFNTIGLFSTIQYLGSLEKAKAFLEKGNKKAVIAKPKKRRLKPGQILGCDYSAAESVAGEVDCFLFIGSGRFHPLGLVAMTNKPVFFLDIERKDMTEISRERRKLEIKRRLRIEKAKGLTNFMIFVSTKPGQTNMKLAEELKNILLKRGKRTFIVTADALTPEKIMGIPADAIVNTACPRIYDDQLALGLVILNPDDVKYL
jgi:2-(3-amino-3-carboxypropyl)histidine synthase